MKTPPQKAAFFIASAFGGRGTRGAVAIGLVAAAAILPIGLLALGSASVARGLAALRGAGSGFRTISSAARHQPELRWSRRSGHQGQPEPEYSSSWDQPS